MSDGTSDPGERPRAADRRTAAAAGSGPRAFERRAHAGSRGAGALYGGLAAAVLGLVLFVGAALLAFSASLVILALVGGRIVGLSVRSGTLGTQTAAARTMLAVGLTLTALTLALVATWAFARLTGGVLDLPSYLLETLGPVVPASYALGALGAWWGAG